MVTFALAALSICTTGGSRSDLPDPFALASPASLLQPTQVRRVDTDLDGIPDSVETSLQLPRGSIGGPLNPRRADLILQVFTRPGVQRATFLRTVLQIRQFFAQLPIPNPDGSTGINVVIVWGDPLPERFATTDYREIYPHAMKAPWRGIARGLLLEAEGGGGQAPRHDWAACENNWVIAVHEIGHMLGLEHEPRGFRQASPLFRSLMDYGYMSVPENELQFSDGKFAGITLNESRLNEILPFPIEDLRFLERQPYFFRLESAGPRLTRIDWNRNGVFDTRPVRADINDGQAVSLGPFHNIAWAAGAPAMTGHGSNVYIAYPTVPPAQRDAWGDEPPGPGRTAGIDISVWDGTRVRPAVRIVPGGATASPSLAVHKLKVMMAVQSNATTIIHGRNLQTLAQDGVAIVRTDADQSLLVPAGDDLHLVTWTRRSGEIAVRPVTVTDGEGSRVQITVGDPAPAGNTIRRDGMNVWMPLRSMHPIGAAYNAKARQLVLATVGVYNRDGTPSGDRSQISFHRLELRREAFVPTARWAPRDSGATPEMLQLHSDAAPVLVIDPRLDDNGSFDQQLIRVYYKVPGASGFTDLARGIRTGGRRTRVMGNIWLNTRGAPAAAVNGSNEIAYALHLHNPDLPDVHNWIQFFPTASGISSDPLGDFNELEWIRTEGLRLVAQIR